MSHKDLDKAADKLGAAAKDMRDGAKEAGHSLADAADRAGDRLSGAARDGRNYAEDAAREGRARAASLADEASDRLDSARREMAKYYDSRRDDAGNLASDIADRGYALAEDVRDEMNRLAQRASRLAREGSESARAEAEHLLRVLRKSGEDLARGTGADRVFSEIAHGAADIVEYGRSNSPSDMANDLSDFARRHPFGFMAGAALLGFAFGRALGGSRRDDRWGRR
ncbi:hypothetical protein ACMA5I_00780 [Paracoccaceae bacterium GXU_MW_L88]